MRSGEVAADNQIGRRPPESTRSSPHTRVCAHPARCQSRAAKNRAAVLSAPLLSARLSASRAGAWLRMPLRLRRPELGFPLPPFLLSSAARASPVPRVCSSRRCSHTETPGRFPQLQQFHLKNMDGESEWRVFPHS